MGNPQRKSPNRPSASEPPIREAWDFDKGNALPDDEVEACYFFEFGREFVLHSDRCWQVVLKLEKAQAAPKTSRKRRGCLSIIKEMADFLGKANPFGCYLATRTVVETPWQKLRQLPEPWQEELLELWSKWEPPPEAHAFAVPLRLVLETEFDAYARAGWAGFDAWAFRQRHIQRESKNHQIGWFSIDWDYRDDVLKKSFAEFLKQRPKNSGTRDDRGRKKLRQHLKALGGKRLLDAGMTAPQASKYTAKVLGQPLYNGDRSWYQARQRANSILSGMFSSS